MSCGKSTRDVCGDFSDPVIPDKGKCFSKGYEVSCDNPPNPTVYFFNSTEVSYTDVCPYGTVGYPITVTIPYFTVPSAVSVADANALALEQAQEEAQALRLLSPCVGPETYCNEEQEYTDTCPEGTIGYPITVTIPACEVESSVSVEEANAIALAMAQEEAEALREEDPCIVPVIAGLSSWGYGGYGALGHGGPNISPYPGDKFTPEAIGSDEWVAIGAGPNANHSLGVKSDGTLWTWGENQYGQLGYATADDQSSTPAQVGSDTDWCSTSSGLAAGDYHSVALKNDGTLWVCGRNNNGQLGLGDLIDVATFTQVGSDTWDFITCGQRFTAGIKSDGTLWGWGLNNDGQLGQGDFDVRDEPIQIGVANNWVMISGGAETLQALASDGTLWATGYGQEGQIGVGNNDGQFYLQQVGSAEWAYVASGYWHTLGIKTDGTLWVWGFNSYGQLGLGNEDSVNTPTQVGSETTWSSAAGGNFFSAALREDGTLWTTGDGSQGELGVAEAFYYSNEFVEAGEGTNWDVVVLGKQHALAISN